jgi:hypothetical protein
MRTPSGLELVFDNTDERTVDRQLKQLDDRLFLDKERDRRTGGLVYVVKQWVGSECPPVPVLEWRDERTRAPAPLSTGIVYAVESRKQFFGRDLVAESVAANDAAQEREEQRAAEEYNEIARDVLKASTTTSAVHRSPHLRIARARAREKQAAEQERLSALARSLERDLHGGNAA